jgi:hypothetical protein
VSYSHTHTHTHIHTHTHGNTQKHTYAFTQTQTHTHRYAHTQTHKHTHTHTHIHTHSHTHTDYRGRASNIHTHTLCTYRHTQTIADMSLSVLVDMWVLAQSKVFFPHFSSSIGIAVHTRILINIHTCIQMYIIAYVHIYWNPYHLKYRDCDKCHCKALCMRLYIFVCEYMFVCACLCLCVYVCLRFYGVFGALLSNVVFMCLCTCEFVFMSVRITLPLSILTIQYTQICGWMRIYFDGM